MPTYDPIRISRAFNRLFSTCPLPTAGSDPEEAMRVYYDVCDGYTTEDIEHAVKRFLAGSVEGHNPSFAPTPPMLAQELRRIDGDNRKWLQRDRETVQQLEDRRLDEEFASGKTADSRARVKALVDGVVQNLTAERRKDVDARHVAVINRTNAAWDQELDTETMASRLHMTAGDDPVARDD